MGGNSTRSLAYTSVLKSLTASMWAMAPSRRFPRKSGYLALKRQQHAFIAKHPGRVAYLSWCMNDPQTATPGRAPTNMSFTHHNCTTMIRLHTPRTIDDASYLDECTLCACMLATSFQLHSQDCATTLHALQHSIYGLYIEGGTPMVRSATICTRRGVCTLAHRGFIACMSMQWLWLPAAHRPSTATALS